jgi:hypothetical protein
VPEHSANDTVSSKTRQGQRTARTGKVDVLVRVRLVEVGLLLLLAAVAVEGYTRESVAVLLHLKVTLSTAGTGRERSVRTRSLA